MEIENVFRAAKEISDKDFLRSVLISLYKQSTPIDIFDATFDKIIEKEVDVITVTADVDIDYSCSVGYDRIEKYLGEEKYRENITGPDKTRIVEKTRTITDWRPFSSSAHSIINCYIRNSAESLNYLEDEDFINEALNGIERTKCENEKVEVKESIYDDARQLCGQLCINNISLPGDRQKNLEWHGVADIHENELHCIKVTEYSVDFEYSDKRYSVKAFGSGKFKLRGEVPIGKEETKIVKKTFKKTFPFLLAEIALFVLAAVYISSYLLYIFIGSFVGVIIAHILFRNYLIKNGLSKLKNKKLKELNYLLHKFNLESHYE